MLENVFAYGSFTNPTPSNVNNVFRMRNPKDFKIYDPKGYTTFLDRFYYLTIESPDDMKI